MTVLALVVTVPASEAELASDALWAAGVLAVEERDPGRGTEDHLVELWTSLGPDPAAVRRITDGFPQRWAWRLVDIDESVADTWRQHARPTWVERDLVIVPAWLDLTFPAGTTVVRIEPGAAFGLGDHPTTVLSLRAVRAALFPGATVLDVGCGSGVLAIAACLLGAARADGLDISPAALEATAANAALNEVRGRVVATADPIASIDGPYDVVVANILAPTLVELADDLRRLVGPSGVLIVSGLLSERHDHVLDALAPMQLVERREREGWVALTLRH